MTFGEMQVKWSVTLVDRLGHEILTVFEIKGQVLHRVRLHVTVPGWFSDLNALLTKKLPHARPVGTNFVPFLVIKNGTKNWVNLRGSGDKKIRIKKGSLVPMG